MADNINQIDMFVGVDPGVSGAAAFIRSDGYVQILDYVPFGRYEYGALLGFQRVGYGLRAVIELQKAFKPTSLENALSMGRYYQDWIAWFKILGIRYDEEWPATWQKAVFDAGTRPKKVKLVKPSGMTEVVGMDFKKRQDKVAREHKKKLKLASVERAKRLYPVAERLITRHDRAEALLIAHFCWLKYH